MVPQSSGLKARYSWSVQPESIAEFSWCLGGKIVAENPNKLSPRNGASLFSKKKEINCVECHCVKLFRVVYFVFRVVIQESRVQIQWVTPRSTQPFVLPRSIKWVPGVSGNLVVKSKLPPWSGSSLEAVEPNR